ARGLCLRQSGSPLGAWPGPEPWGGGGGARSEAGVTEGRGLPVAAQVRPLGPAGQVGQVGPAPPSGRPRAGGSAAASGLGHRPGSRVQVRRLPGRGSQLLGTTPAPGQSGSTLLYSCQRRGRPSVSPHLLQHLVL
uniref:Uncharacterized protein n=1 Tax=Mustela putorius furo TaxID=9669 RepID=M3Y1R1_MUSPF